MLRYFCSLETAGDTNLSYPCPQTHEIPVAFLCTRTTKFAWLKVIKCSEMMPFQVNGGLHLSESFLVSVSSTTQWRGAAFALICRRRYLMNPLMNAVPNTLHGWLLSRAGKNQDFWVVPNCCHHYSSNHAWESNLGLSQVEVNFLPFQSATERINVCSFEWVCSDVVWRAYWTHFRIIHRNLLFKVLKGIYN